MTGRSYAELLMVMALWSVGCGCSDPQPDVGVLLDNPTTKSQGSLDRYLKQRFPAGSDEAALRNELQREGFVIVRYSDFVFIARREARRFECRSHWTVQWSMAEGRVGGLQTNLREDCL